VSRVSEAIRAANDQGRAALIVYLPAGFPDMATSQACLEAAAANGADLLEIGFPYSDPLMDGPIIQQANQTAMDAGYTPRDDLAMCRQLNARVDVPTLVMTYYNILWHYQAPDRLQAFASDAAAAGLAGAIVPDLPVDESRDWLASAAAARASDGFVYATSTLGVTGTRESLSERAGPLVARLRNVTSDPVCVGIGVSTAAHAETVARFADGVIVGSAAVRAAADGGPAAVANLVSELAAGCRRGYASTVRVADSTR
jgi:tryptophan synthase alpha chain